MTVPQSDGQEPPAAAPRGPPLPWVLRGLKRHGRHPHPLPCAGETRTTRTPPLHAPSSPPPPTPTSPAGVRVSWGSLSAGKIKFGPKLLIKKPTIFFSFSLSISSNFSLPLSLTHSLPPSLPPSLLPSRTSLNTCKLIDVNKHIYILHRTQ